MSKSLPIIFRRIRKDKLNSLIIALGLSSVLFCSIFVGSYIDAEINAESHYTNKERIVKLFINYQNEDQHEHFDVTSHGLTDLLASIPSVEEVTQIYETEADIKTDRSPVSEDEFYFVTYNFWKVFDLKFITGKPFSATEAHEIVISAKIARKYFNSIHVTGETLFINNQERKVVGVFEDLPTSTNIPFQALMPVTKEIASYEVGSFDCISFVLLKDVTLFKQFEEDLAQFDLDIYQPLIEALFEDSGFRVWHDFLPFDQLRESQKGYIQSEILVGLLGLILIIFLINTGNLGYSKSIQNAKTTGIRKILGVHKTQIIKQSIIEGIMYSIVALIIATTIMQLSKTRLQSFVDGQINISYSNITLLTLGFVIALFVFIYSLSTTPLFKHSAQALIKNQFSIGTTKQAREWVLGVQFAISFIVICICWLIYQQYAYMTNADLGFESDNKRFISIPFDNDFNTKSKAFQSDVMTISGVEKTAFGHRPGYIPFISTYSKDAEESPSLVNGVAVDENYLDFFELNLIAGRNFYQKKSKLDSTLDEIIINQAFAQKLGFDNPVGQTISFIEKSKIIGVVENYHFASLRFKIDPLVIKYANAQVGQLLISGRNIEKKQLEKAWHKHYPNHPFNIGFLDKELEVLYAEELKLSRMLGFLAVIGVLLSTIGLYAVSRNNQLARIKEVGIRKILGAKIIQIFNLLLNKTLIVIAISIVITIPLIIHFTNLWLEQYQNRISISIILFLAPVLILLMFIALSVGFHTYRTANANPVDSLRHE